jgi:hypothetical protein
MLSCVLSTHQLCVMADGFKESHAIRCLCLNKTPKKKNVDVCWNEAMLSMLCLSQAYGQSSSARLKTSGSLRVQFNDVCEMHAVSWFDSPQTCVMCRRRQGSPFPTWPIGRCWKESRQLESLHCARAPRNTRAILTFSFASSKAVLFTTCHEKGFASVVRRIEPVQFAQRAQRGQEDPTHARPLLKWHYRQSRSAAQEFAGRDKTRQNRLRYCANRKQIIRQSRL